MFQALGLTAEGAGALELLLGKGSRAVLGSILQSYKPLTLHSAPPQRV